MYVVKGDFDEVYLFIYILKGVMGNLGMFVLYNVSKLVESVFRNDKWIVDEYFVFVIVFNEMIVVVDMFI